MSDSVEAQLINILRDRLKVSVNVSASNDFYSKSYDIKVSLVLDDVMISESSGYVDVASRDTSENWRSPFD